MGKEFQYTTLAHRYTARFPLITYVGTQINFWILANLLLAMMLHLQSILISHTFNEPVSGQLSPMLFISILLGVLYGLILGVTGYFLDRTLVRNLPLGRVILFKTSLSLAVLFLLLSFIRYFLYEPFIAPSRHLPGISLDEYSWRLIFYLFLIYYFVMTLVINFINQINKKYGPGVLIPLLLGRYRKPKEEVRIFIFMDLKSSTTTAEKLGHLKYSSFIRDCFADINDVLYPYRAQVYQYVGDEIVVTWQEDEGLKNHFCIEFYFACRRKFQTRAEYYMANYGLIPEFKASVHSGIVTAVEIGEVKRGIAYHGDTLNTAARIQSVCNQYNRNFIASDQLIKKVGPHQKMNTEELGMILLKGKTTEVGLVAVEWME